MSDNGIGVRCEARVASISLDNPPFNPIGVAQVAGLRQAMDQLAADREVRAIVIRGAGSEHFSVGANLKEVQVVADVGSEAFCRERHELYQQIEDMPKPVIAAISGYCLGGGCELALACHFRLADPSAKIGLPEINLGAAPMWGGAWRIVRTVGRARGLDMLLNGRRIGAEEAASWGLLHQVFAAGQFDEGVTAFAHHLATKAPLAVAAIINVVNAQQDMDPVPALNHELQEFDALTGSRDNIEGVTALFEKRSPVFTGE